MNLHMTYKPSKYKIGRTRDTRMGQRGIMEDRLGPRMCVHTAYGPLPLIHVFRHKHHKVRPNHQPSSRNAGPVNF